MNIMVPSSYPTPGEYAGRTQVSSHTFPDEENPGHYSEQFEEITSSLMESESESEKQPHEGFVKHEWRPLYLRRWLLLSCSLLCVSLIVAVELLSWYSTKNNGLAESTNRIHYLWTYGPTAILTVIGAMWTRTDYQAKITAPWNRLARGPAAAEKTLLLDYIDPLPPVSIVKATKNGDFGVAAAATIALLWSLVIAFSASLISLSPTDGRQETVPVELTTTFKNDSAALEDSRSLSYYNMLGLQQANLAFPDGLSGGYAYQRFTGRALSPTTELQVTVDGFSSDLECEEASYHLSQASWIDTGYPIFNFTMASDSCRITSGWFGPQFVPNRNLYYSRLGTGSCQNSSDPDDQRIVVTFAGLRYSDLPTEVPFPNSPIDLNITKSVNLLCRPTYTIDKVDVVKNGSDLLSLTPSASPGLTKLGNIHAWNITQAIIRSTYNPLTTSYINEEGILLQSQEFNASDIRVDVDPQTYIVLGQQSTAPPSSAALFNTSLLHDLMIPYYRNYSAFIVNDLLTDSVSTESTGQAVVYQQRLLVNATAAHAMAGILGVSVLLLLVVVITTPDVGVLACAPSNISVVPAQLRVTNSFSNNTHFIYGYSVLSSLAAPLILESNLSYPKFTYETLLFPELSLDFNSSTATEMDNGAELNVTIPAIRPKMTCRLHDSSSIIASVSESHQLNINITGEACYPTGIVAGVVGGFCGDTSKSFEYSSDWVYYWTDIRMNPDPEFASISALVCNETLEAVDVFTSFIGADLTIDPKNPPIPNEATAHDTAADIGVDTSNIFESLQSGPLESLDNFFSTLLISPWAIPLDYLRDPSKAEDVRDAIIFQHRLVRAERVNYVGRAPPDKTDALVRETGEDDVLAFPVNVTHANTESHIVQDAASTRILQTLLAAILLFSLGSWAIIPSTRILPREPTSIASVMALLADGNVFNLLPTGWQLSEEKDIERLFSDITFKMGWAGFASSEQEGGANDDNTRFSIYGFQYVIE
ncbi:hypothetical protein ONZ43_g4313 [Nemania bipapillata]|uniref:Uncharacterized protein n=1 Tax=Nemania bipapillata TaxID=110536 RepID=A0ACC2IP17_9PEZI|nr:hypothetical protein ONZ43_g4313 [Nemania bipapillata]